MIFKSFLIGTLALVAASCASTSEKQLDNNRVSKNGVIQRMQYTPTGDVEGFVLQDGTQIQFSAHSSADILRIAGTKDAVIVTGEKDERNVLHAERIENKKTAQSIDVFSSTASYRPTISDDNLAPAASPVPPQVDRVHMKKMSARGTIKSQMFDPQGEVNGVVLSDNTVVHFPPNLASEAIKGLDIGQKLRASGYGKHSAGKRIIEAEEISNY